MVFRTLNRPQRFGWWFGNPVNSAVDLVDISIFIGVLYIPGGCLGFLNHQQYEYACFFVQIILNIATYTSHFGWKPKNVQFSTFPYFPPFLAGQGTVARTVPVEPEIACSKEHTEKRAGMATVFLPRLQTKLLSSWIYLSWISHLELN